MDLTPNSKPGELNAERNPDGSITTYQANGCYTTASGGSETWRNNNPGNLVGGNGKIGDSNGKAIFPDYQTGKDALEEQFRDISRTSPGYTVENVLQNMASTNGWPDVTPALNAMKQAGIDTDRKFSSDFQPANCMETILARLESFFGFTAGETSDQTCPEASSAD